MKLLLLAFAVLASRASSLLQRVSSGPYLGRWGLKSSRANEPGIDLGETADVDLRKPTMLVNNLGGMGPDMNQAEEIRIANAFPYYGRSVDVVVEALTPYKGNVSKNLLDGTFAQLNLARGTSVKLKVSFVDHDTKQPVTLHRFALSVLDLDAGMDDGQINGFETILTGPLHSYSLSSATELVKRYAQDADDYLIFNSSTVGHMYDNPQQGEPVTEEQKNRAVILEFVSTAKVRLSLFASSASVGRTFVIGGAHILGDGFIRTKVGPCTNHRHLELSSVLSTDLAGEGMRFANVFPYAGQHVDLLVRADDRYKAWNTSKNGLNGSCGVVNLASGTSTVLTFSFVDSKTDAPVQMGRFFFSLLDLDATKHGFEAVKVNKTTWSRFWVFTNASIVQDMEGDLRVFRSTSVGSVSDNPIDPTDSHVNPMSESVTLFMKEARREFKVVFEASPGTLTGRNILFSGRTSYVCPDL